MVESPIDVALPLEADLARLPKFAIVAYAIRNALRVLPLFQQMTFYCERDQFQNYARELIKILRMSCQPRELAGVDSKSVETARDAARTAAYAHAMAASRAAFAVNRAYSAADERVDATRAASFAAAFATTAFAAAAKPAPADEEAARSQAARVAARHDFDTLVKFCENSDPAGLAEIDVSEGGPLGVLWPESPPDWYVDALPKWRAALQSAGLADFHGADEF